MPSDSCRKQQLFGALAKSYHPMAKFMWRNSSSLQLPNYPDCVELNRCLRLFWQQHYTANRMTVVLQSKHDLDRMKEWAASVFQDIPSSSTANLNDGHSFDELGSPLFDTPLLKRIVQVVPVKDVNQVLN